MDGIDSYKSVGQVVNVQTLHSLYSGLSLRNESVSTKTKSRFLGANKRKSNDESKKKKKNDKKNIVDCCVVYRD